MTREMFTAFLSTLISIYCATYLGDSLVYGALSAAFGAGGAFFFLQTPYFLCVNDEELKFYHRVLDLLRLILWVVFSFGMLITVFIYASVALINAMGGIEVISTFGAILSFFCGSVCGTVAYSATILTYDLVVAKKKGV